MGRRRVSPKDVSSSRSAYHGRRLVCKRDAERLKLLKRERKNALFNMGCPIQGGEAGPSVTSLKRILTTSSLSVYNKQAMLC
jgi:hypothetical protein